MFTYDEGKNHASYFDDNYLPTFLDQDDLVFDNATLGKLARVECGDNKQCLFDIHTTGKVRIGKASKESVESFIAIINETETPGKQNHLIRKATRNICKNICFIYSWSRNNSFTVLILLGNLFESVANPIVNFKLFAFKRKGAFPRHAVKKSEINFGLHLKSVNFIRIVC